MTAPPTTTSQGASNCQLLLNFTNSGIIDAASGNDLETVGNAQCSTGTFKYSESTYFDGVNDSVDLPFNSQCDNFGSGDFTMECWVYRTSSATEQDIMKGQSDLATAAGSSYEFAIGSTSLSRFYVSTTQYLLSAPVDPTINTWAHIAYVRHGSTFYGYLNGVMVGSVAVSGAMNRGTTTYPTCIGIQTPSGSLDFQGYIEDLRLTKYARYPSGTTFTPPTPALPVQ
jgi:hypothetical protein